MILRELFVKLGLSIDSASFAEGQAAVDALKAGLEKFVEWTKEGIEALVEMTKGAVETSEELHVTAQSIGITTDALQEMTYVGSLAGVGADELTQSVRLLSRSMYEAAHGTGEQAKAFQRLGIHVTDAHGQLKGADDVIGEIAGKFSTLPDGAEKTALSLELFGRAGARMVPLLNKGADGIAELRQEAHELGFVLDEDMIKQGVEVEHTWRRISAMWTGMKNKIGAALFPVLKKAAESMERWLKANREWIKSGLESAIKGIIVVAKIVAEAFVFVARNADLIIGALAAMSIAFLILKADAIEAAMATLGAWLAAAAPVIALGAALAGLLLMIDDIRMYAKYGDKAKTVTGDVVKFLDEFAKPKGKDPWWLVSIREFAATIKEAIELLRELTGVDKTKRVDRDTALKKEDVQWRADKMTLQSAKNRNDLGLPLTAEENSAVARLSTSDPAFLASQGFESPSLPAGAFGPIERPSLPSMPLSPMRNIQTQQTNYMTVNAAPGMTADDVGKAVVDKLNEHWDTKMEEAASGVP